MTANDTSRTYGAANPDFTARFDGFVLGEDAGDLGGDARLRHQRRPRQRRRRATRVTAERADQRQLRHQLRPTAP